MLRKSLTLLLSIALIAGSWPPAGNAGPVSYPFAELTPPKRLGYVTDYYNRRGDVGTWGRNSNGVTPQVILIRDLHAHYGVQKNIAGLLDFLSSRLPSPSWGDLRVRQQLNDPAGPASGKQREGIGAVAPKGEGELGRSRAPLTRSLSPSGERGKRIPFVLCVEGAEGPVDTSGLLPGGPDRSSPVTSTVVHREALDFLLREAEIGGPEYFAARRGLANVLVGVEDRRFYETHHDLFRQSYDHREKLVRMLTGIQTELAELRPRVYSKDLLPLRKASAAWMTPEQKVAGFMKAMELAGTEEEKNLWRIEEDLELLLKIADLRATEEDVRTFGPRVDQFLAMTRRLVGMWGPPFAKASGDKRGDVGVWDEKELRELLASSIDYYSLAMLRNEPMVENTLALLGQRGSEEVAASPPRLLASSPSTAVLVAGGFHTKAIADLLNQRGVSYLVITPSVDRFTEEDHARYIKRLRGIHLSDAEVVAAARDARRPIRRLVSHTRDFMVSRQMLATGFYEGASNLLSLFKMERQNKLLTHPVTRWRGNLAAEKEIARLQAKLDANPGHRLRSLWQHRIDQIGMEGSDKRAIWIQERFAPKRERDRFLSVKDAIRFVRSHGVESLGALARMHGGAMSIVFHFYLTFLREAARWIPYYLSEEVAIDQHQSHRLPARDLWRVAVDKGLRVAMRRAWAANVRAHRAYNRRHRADGAALTRHSRRSQRNHRANIQEFTDYLLPQFKTALQRLAQKGFSRYNRGTSLFKAILASRKQLRRLNNIEPTLDWVRGDKLLSALMLTFINLDANRDIWRSAEPVANGMSELVLKSKFGLLFKVVIQRDRGDGRLVFTFFEWLDPLGEETTGSWGEIGTIRIGNDRWVEQDLKRDRDANRNEHDLAVFLHLDSVLEVTPDRRVYLAHNYPLTQDWSYSSYLRDIESAFRESVHVFASMISTLPVYDGSFSSQNAVPLSVTPEMQIPDMPPSHDLNLWHALRAGRLGLAGRIVWAGVVNLVPGPGDATVAKSDEGLVERLLVSQGLSAEGMRVRPTPRWALWRGGRFSMKDRTVYLNPRLTRMAKAYIIAHEIEHVKDPAANESVIIDRTDRNVEQWLASYRAMLHEPDRAPALPLAAGFSQFQNGFSELLERLTRDRPLTPRDIRALDHYRQSFLRAA